MARQKEHRKKIQTFELRTDLGTDDRHLLRRSNNCSSVTVRCQSIGWCCGYAVTLLNTNGLSRDSVKTTDSLQDRSKNPLRMAVHGGSQFRPGDVPEEVKMRRMLRNAQERSVEHGWMSFHQNRRSSFSAMPPHSLHLSGLLWDAPLSPPCRQSCPTAFGAIDQIDLVPHGYLLDASVAISPKYIVQAALVKTCSAQTFFDRWTLPCSSNSTSSQKNQ